MSASATLETLFNKEPTVTDNKTKMQAGLCGDNESEGAVDSQNRDNSRNGCVDKDNGLISGCCCCCWPGRRRPGLLCTAATTSWGPAGGAETSPRRSSSANTQLFHSDSHTHTDLSHEVQDFSFRHLCIRTLTPAKLVFQRFCVRDTDALQVPTHTHTL